MSVRPIVVLAVLAGLTLGATSSLAADGMSSGKPANGMALSLFLYGRDVPLPVLTPLQQAVVGVGAGLSGKMGSSAHWAWNLSGGFGVGSVKGETSSGGVTTTDELSLSEWEARLGMDYWTDCCDEYFYCGPGLIYMSNKLTEKSTGSPDIEFDPIKVFGIDPHAGGAVKCGSSASIFGDMDVALGYASYKQTTAGVEDKLTGWFHSVGWHGGVRIGF